MELTPFLLFPTLANSIRIWPRIERENDQRGLSISVHIEM